MISNPRPDDISVTGPSAHARPAEVLAGYQRSFRMFMGVELKVAPGVLVPRSETEAVGRAAVRFLETSRAGRAANGPVRVIDLCCGSGNLTCGLAAAVPSARVWASDLTEPCVELTRWNVRNLGLADRVRVFQGDLFAPLAGEGIEGRVDLIVCNPPYIPTKLLDARADLRDEPREAFDGGPYGLSVLMRVLREAPRFLRPGGGLFLEVGPRAEQHALDLTKRAREFEGVSVIRTDAGDVWGIHGRKATPGSPEPEEKKTKP